jgi:hypothetical protein
MAAPVFVKRTVWRIGAESTLYTKAFAGYLSVGHHVRIRWNLSVVENADYGAGGNSTVYQSVWSAIRNSTGAASTDGAVFEASDVADVGAGAGVGVIVNFANGNLTLTVDPPATGIITGSATLDLYSWPNTVTS